MDCRVFLVLLANMVIKVLLVTPALLAQGVHLVLLVLLVKMVAMVSLDPLALLVCVALTVAKVLLVLLVLLVPLAPLVPTVVDMKLALMQNITGLISLLSDPRIMKLMPL